MPSVTKSACYCLGVWATYALAGGAEALGFNLLVVLVYLVEDGAAAPSHRPAEPTHAYLLLYVGLDDVCVLVVGDGLVGSPVLSVSELLAESDRDADRPKDMLLLSFVQDSSGKTPRPRLPPQLRIMKFPGGIFLVTWGSMNP